MTLRTWVPWLGGLLCLVGCGGAPSSPCVPVSGEIRFQGAPVAEATVLFVPEVPFKPHLPNPLGITDSQGKFQLTTLQAGDGAPPGRYTVTVELRDLITTGEEQTRGGKHLLPIRYSQMKTSGLRAEIAATGTEPLTFELKQ